MIDRTYLKKHIDFTLIRPDSSLQEITAFCMKAIEHQVTTIYVPLPFVKFARSLVEKYDIAIGTTAGFPHGNCLESTKLNEITHAKNHGATWVDVPLNLHNVKSKNWNNVKSEMKTLVEHTVHSKICLKLIIETPFLTKEEIIQVINLAEECGVTIIKTATGVGNKVTIDEVKILLNNIKNAKIKAAGGITSIDIVRTLFSMGVTYVGSSKGFEILEMFK